jgi:hypothetical protein
MAHSSNHSRVLSSVLVLLLGVELSVTFAQLGSPTAANRSYEFQNGKWFDGRNFSDNTFYTVHGMLTEQRPSQLDSVIDLKSKYVIPPLGEAHIHHLNDAKELDKQIQGYVARGIFYAMVQDAMFEITPDILDKVNRPNSVDVVYAQGVLLAPWYDSVLNLYQMIATQGGFGSRKTIEELDEDVIFLISDRNDFERKWPKIGAKNKDIVKILLAFSDEYDSRRSRQREGVPGPGIDPELLPHIVQRVHSAGLRASVHVETAVDFRVALLAGADIIAHFPGWRIGQGAGFFDGKLNRWKLSEADARLAAQRNVAVVTTTLPKTFLPNSEESQPKFAEIHSHNLKLLSNAGVTIAIGSDSRRHFVTGEIKQLPSYGVLDNLKMLKLATEVTAKVIFPTRNIGNLTEGYEASFLVLETNPIDDLKSLDKISLRVKQGNILKSQMKSLLSN